MRVLGKILLRPNVHSISSDPDSALGLHDVSYLGVGAKHAQVCAFHAAVRSSFALLEPVLEEWDAEFLELLLGHRKDASVQLLKVLPRKLVRALVINNLLLRLSSMSRLFLVCLIDFGRPGFCRRGVRLGGYTLLLRGVVVANY